VVELRLPIKEKRKKARGHKAPKKISARDCKGKVVKARDKDKQKGGGGSAHKKGRVRTGQTTKKGSENMVVKVR